LLATVTFSTLLAFANESLPEIAPVDEPAPPAIDAPAEE